MVDEKNDKKTAIDRAFSDLADEFSDNSKGAGASLGRSAKFIAGAIEVVVTSPLLIPKGYEKVIEKMKPMIEKETQKIPEDKLVEPDLAIAGPALEAMRFSIDEEEVADLFAKLLAASMHADRKSRAHHSFVEIIKQLSPAEARLVKFLGQKGGWPVVDLQAADKDTTQYSVVAENITDIGEYCGIPDHGLVQVYVDNLCRLGICQMPHGIYLVDEEAYAAIERSEVIKAPLAKIEEWGKKPNFERKALSLTQFGSAFHSTCVQDN